MRLNVPSGLSCSACVNQNFQRLRIHESLLNVGPHRLLFKTMSLSLVGRHRHSEAGGLHTLAGPAGHVHLRPSPHRCPPVPAAQCRARGTPGPRTPFPLPGRRTPAPSTQLPPVPEAPAACGDAPTPVTAPQPAFPCLPPFLCHTAQAGPCHMLQTDAPDRGRGALSGRLP